MFSAVPALTFLSEINWNNFATHYLVPIGVLLLIFVGPHVIAAQIFTPKSNVLVVIAASLMQLLFGALVAWVFFVLAIGGWVYLSVGALIVFVMSALVMTGIYRFEFVKGLGYNAVALLIIAGIAWGSFKLYPEVMARRVVTPLLMHGIRFAASFHESEEAAQREAVKDNPDLGVAGSEFNRRFLEKVAKYRAERPDELRSKGWPVVIASEVKFDLLLERLAAKQAAKPSAN